jgi:hypothetical protein
MGASATPSLSSSGKTRMAACPPGPPPVVPLVGEATKRSPVGEKRSWRVLPTLPK